MFGQGHGFASAMGGSAGFGSANKTSNDDMMRDLLRNRNGSVTGQGPDLGKREYNNFSLTPDAPASTMLNSRPDTFAGFGFQDQKQRKKGKKHRHANTSSSGGGGLVDLGDPSILQARMHHGGVGQGQYGSQGQSAYSTNNMMYGGAYGSRW